MECIFKKFFVLGLGLGLEICWSRPRSWSWKNYQVSVSMFVASTELHPLF